MHLEWILFEVSMHLEWILFEVYKKRSQAIHMVHSMYICLLASSVPFGFEGEFEG